MFTYINIYVYNTPMLINKGKKMTHKLTIKDRLNCEYRGVAVKRFAHEGFRSYQATKYTYDVPSLKIVAFSMPELKRKVDARIDQGVA